MKVLKAPDTNWQYECTCDKCDAELLVEQDDLYMQTISAEYYCYCAICSNRISFDSNKIPKIVKINVEKKRNSSSSSIDMRDVGCGPPWQDR